MTPFLVSYLALGAMVGAGGQIGGWRLQGWWRLQPLIVALLAGFAAWWGFTHLWAQLLQALIWPMPKHPTPLWIERTLIPSVGLASFVAGVLAVLLFRIGLPLGRWLGTAGDGRFFKRGAYPKSLRQTWRELGLEVRTTPRQVREWWLHRNDPPKEHMP